MIQKHFDKKARYFSELFLYVCKNKTIMEIIAIIAVLVVALVAFIYSADKAKASNDEYKSKMNITDDDVFETHFKYVSGHTSINKHIEYPLTFIHTKNLIRVISKLRFSKLESGVFLFDLDINSILDISVEDSTTIEKKVTLTRLLAVGIFAFAWKKKKVNELAFVVITYTEGRFENNIVLQIEGANSLLSANQLRNKLINWVQ